MTTQNYFQARLSQGKMNEVFFKSIIEKDIKEKLKTNGDFDLFDFENENYKIELKTREVERNKYKTTIIGYDKIQQGLKYIEENKNIIFYFGFKKDGLFKFKLTQDNYKDFKISNIGCRFRENKKPHLEIPVEILEFVCKECPIQDEYSLRLQKGSQ
jgi:hypothetical protein